MFHPEDLLRRLLYSPAMHPRATLLVIFLISTALAPGVFLVDMRPVLEGDLPVTDERDSTLLFPALRAPLRKIVPERPCGVERA